MFGLPIYRTGSRTAADCPDPDPFGRTCDPCTDPKLKVSPSLVELILNHYTVIISRDKRNMRAWGACSKFGNTATGDTNIPQTSNISWEIPSQPESILTAYSYGYDNFSIFHTKEKKLYGTGSNTSGVLGRNDAGSSYRLLAKDVIDYHCAGNSYIIYVKTDGSVYVNHSLQAGINNARKVFATAPGGDFKFFVLLEDGTVKARGTNTSGCLGVNSSSPTVNTWETVKTQIGGSIVNLTNVKEVFTSNWVLVGGANSSAETWAGGGYTTFMSSYFLTKDGSVYTCGSNKFGQLGLGQGTSFTTNIATKTSITKAAFMCTGAGGTSCLVSTSDNELFTWGNNQFGQLGLGDRTHRSSPTQAIFPNKKIKNVNGGGINGVINGAFVVICEDGSLYGAGFNQTYALGITTGGSPNPGPITTFSRNEYFGDNPPLNQDPARYPLVIGGFTTTSNSSVIEYTTNYQLKTPGGYSSPQRVYIKPGMLVEGPGIPTGAKVINSDCTNTSVNTIVIDQNVILPNANITLTFRDRIFVEGADLCGYGTEMAQKVVRDNGDLYMSGWNQTQSMDGYWNFNYYYGSENVAVPTYFDAAFA